ncbi:MAG: hypothetical protein P8130_09665 [Deltaproteobacteria bacterium]
MPPVALAEHNSPERYTPFLILDSDPFPPAAGWRRARTGQLPDALRYLLRLFRNG